MRQERNVDVGWEEDESANLAKRRPMKSAKICAISALLLAAPAAYAQAGDHAAEVEVFARIMADVRTAAEVCQGLSPDWTLVNAQKDRLHVADVDYFAFRKQAHDRTEVLEQRFRAEHGSAGWCSDVLNLYGPQGSANAGLLHR